MTTKRYQKLLHKELSYQIQGAAIEVRKNFGPGHKESLYQNAFAEELQSRGIKFEREKSIKIYSPKTKKFIGLYRPDFIIEGKILVELKAVKKIPKMFINQLYDYLRNSKYELGYFINLASPKLYIKRIIFTNDRKPFLKTLLVVLSLIFVLFSVSMSEAKAARLYFEPQELTIGTEGEFLVAIKVDAEEAINTLGVAIAVSPLLIPHDVSNANSIINFWVDKPHWDQTSGLLTFSGIIPGGFSGKGANLLIVKFRAEKEGVASLGFDAKKTEAFLHTPDGIRDSLKLEELSLPVVKGKENIPLIIPDNDSPESFVPEIARDPNIFDGQWFLVFATQDKGSGIAGYAIHESTRIKTRIDTKDWKTAESPYLLKDQKLHSYIYVKAVDKAGNERIEMLPPQKPLAWYENELMWVIIILGLIMVCFIYLIGQNLWRVKAARH